MLNHFNQLPLSQTTVYAEDALEREVDLELQQDVPYSHHYFEGSDACGKDTIANHMVTLEVEGIEYPPRKGCGFFMPDSDDKLRSWRTVMPSEELRPALLLAATVRDLCMAGLAKRQDLSAYQASHHSIRGTAYEIAFGLPLQELFDETVAMVPPAYLPIALQADLSVLGDRVRQNPESTPFDFMVIEQPEKIATMLAVIEDRCKRLGGIAIDTNHKTPDEIAQEILTIRPSRQRAAVWEDPDTVVDKGAELLGNLAAMRPYYRVGPVVDGIVEEIYAR